MPHLEWTTPAEKSWLETRVRAEYTYQTDVTRYNWSRGIARDFMDDFPREKRELKGRLESDEELEERWRKVETVRRTCDILFPLVLTINHCPSEGPYMDPKSP